MFHMCAEISLTFKPCYLVVICHDCIQSAYRLFDIEEVIAVIDLETQSHC